MGVETAIILGGLAVGATAAQMSAAEDAEDKQYAAAQEQKKARQEQDAANASQAAAEKRRQIREERVKRARVLQSATSTGTTGSSGETGAVAGLSTQLGANLGANLGTLQTAQNISIFSQTSADLMTQANALQADSQFWGQVAGLSMMAANASMPSGKK